MTGRSEALHKCLFEDLMHFAEHSEVQPPNQNGRFGIRSNQDFSK
jgi:hypothetical protein